MPRKNSAEDFWGRVDRSGDCWLWRGALTPRGYGKTHFNGKNYRAHRLAFYLQFGQSPDAVLHKCDNPRCVNPSHLMAGDNGKNNRDRALKGRSHKPKGELHPLHRLREADVIEIRKMASSRDVADIAEMFSVHKTTVKDIVRGRRWKHISMQPQP